MKRFIRIAGIVVSWLLISAPMLTLAADVTQATYRADIAITNNGTAASNQSTVFTLNSTQLLNQNFVNAALNNTAIINNLGEDTPFMPGANASQPWVVWVSSIGGAITQVNYNLYTGGNQSMQSNIAYFPGAAGMNVTDNASLELGGNFSIEQKGFFNAATNGSANKTGSFSWNKTGTNLTTHAFVNATLTLYPTANVSLGSFTSVFGANTSQQAVATNDGNTSYIYATNPGAGFTSNSTWSGNASSYSLNGTIAYVRVYMVTSANGTFSYPAGYAQLFAQGIAIGVNTGFTNGVWTTFNTTLYSQPAGGAWDWAAINALTFGVYMAGDGGMELRCTQIYVEVNYAQEQVITSTGVSSAEHTVKTTIESGNITNYIDGVKNGTVTLNGTGITDNGNIWNFAEASTMPYMHYTAITINNTLAANWSWQYGSLFTDLTGNGHTATPTFRTTTSDADISANMTTFTPLDETTSTYTNPAIGTYNLTGAFTQPGGMYTELTISLPGSDVINDLLDGSSIPRALFWFPVLFGIINLFGLGVYALTKNIFVQAICMGVLVMFFSLAGGYGYWVFIEYCIIAIAIILGERQSAF